MKTLAYLYRWTNKTTGQWYVGSRTKKGCYPNDGYICSSKVVKPLVLENKENWLHEILAIGNASYITELEVSYLKSVDAMHNRMSYNMHNGDGKFSMAGKVGGRTGKAPWNKGLTKNNTSGLNGGRTKGCIAWNKGTLGSTPWNKGLTMSEEQKQKISVTMKSKNLSRSKTMLVEDVAKVVV